ncbi:MULTISPECIES: sirohydrochlorin chelatase [unclassified Oceanobacter]|uniref:sirohydrochlorin chelatase n=1 Tax=unclassified Oceanobacter TaxID=2620260 RepID=UPI002734DA28|nr:MULTISPECIES: CbiX/SirB N-terminal domain-containing protein [unclassified Oceanobacter]MDP2505768.1 CbiX/SirB N-terminal domain-containing protein [Oceanobacter sp. 3_MG-2023]MDP2547405.1 CbiX/SirB N-terminal domain-containing protein [Oceanobacter sp. 4_MG-2023]
MQTRSNNHATILLAHGSSDPNWLKPFEQLTGNICAGMAKPNQIQLAYMELAEPSLENMIATLSNDGVTHIDILPLFFAAGRHLRQDVPEQIEALQRQHLVKLTLHPPVGLEPEVATAISNVVVRKLMGE